MNKICLLGLVFVWLSACQSGSDTVRTNDSTGFDSTLARNLGADKFGMREFTLCFLNHGPSQLIETAQLRQMDQEHYNLLRNLSKEGHVVFAAIFPDHDDHAEMLAFTVEEEKARELLAAGPKIKRGILQPTFTTLYSSAALPELAKIHQRINANAQELEITK